MLRNQKSPFLASIINIKILIILDISTDPILEWSESALGPALKALDFRSESRTASYLTFVCQCGLPQGRMKFYYIPFNFFQVWIFWKYTPVSGLYSQQFQFIRLFALRFMLSMLTLGQLQHIGHVNRTVIIKIKTLMILSHEKPCSFWWNEWTTKYNYGKWMTV